MQAPHRIGPVEIGQRTGDPQGTVPRAGRETQPFGGAGEQRAAFGIGLGDRGQEVPSVSALHRGLDQPRAQSDSRPAAGSASTSKACPCVELGQPLALDGARRGHPRGDIGRAFGGRRQSEIGGLDRGHVDAEIDAVEQRARQLALIVERRSAGRGRRRGSALRWPQRQGFIAATSWKRAG